MIRLFIAIPLPEELKNGLGQSVRNLRRLDADVKWVEEENLHLTVKFIGDYPEDDVPALIAELEDAAALNSQFKLSFSRAGYFPNRRDPRVIWLGLEGDIEPANRLGTDIDARLQAWGMAPEKRRRWHLTLGRVRSDRNIQLLQNRLEELMTAWRGRTWGVDHFILYQSILTPRGPIYKELARFDLK